MTVGLTMITAKDCNQEDVGKIRSLEVIEVSLRNQIQGMEVFRGRVFDLTGQVMDELLPFEEELKEELERRRISLPSNRQEAKNRIKEWDSENSLEAMKKYYSNKEYKEVIQIFGNLYRIINDDVEIHNLRIRSHYNLSEDEECISACELALEHIPDYHDARRFIGRCSIRNGDNERAMTIFNELAEIFPLDVDSLIMLMRLHYGAKNLEESFDYCRLLLEIEPDNNLALLMKCRILQATANWRDLLDVSKRLLELDPTNAEVLIYCGRANYSLNMYQEAQALFENALEHAPDDRRAIRNLALVYFRMGQWENALAKFDQECEASPEDSRNWDMFIQTLYKLNRGDEGKNVIERIQELIEDPLQANLITQSICSSFHWDEELANCSQAGLENWGDDPRYHLVTARMKFEDGDLSSSLESVIEVEKIEDRSEEAYVIRKEIQDFLEENNLNLSFLEEEIKAGRTLYKSECTMLALLEKARSIERREIKQGPMKVAMVSSSLGRGGAERQVVTCLKGIENDDAIESANLFCFDIDNTGGTLDTYYNDVKTLNVGLHLWGRTSNWREEYADHLHLLDPWIPLLDYLPDNIRRDIEPLYLMFKVLSPDIVHSWQDSTNIHSAIAAEMAGVPGIVMFIRSLRPDGKTMMHIRTRPYLHRLYKALLEDERIVMAANSNAGTRSYETWLGLADDRIKVIHNGVDFDLLAQSSEGADITSTLEEHGIPSDATIVGSVFRFVQEKQPTLWVEVLEKLVEMDDSVHGVIVGGGGLHAQTLNLIKEKNLDHRIHLVGQSRAVVAWLREFDIFLLTSKIEGLPNVLIEAQAFGVPVVSTDAGGSADTFLHGETGQLVKDHDPTGLAVVINRSLSDPQWMQIARDRSSSETRNRFSTDSMIDRLKELYRMSIHLEY